MSAAFTKSEQSAACALGRNSQDRALGLSESMSSLMAQAEPPVLRGERLLAAEAMWLLIRLDRDIREARAQWNQDWFRRLMHARAKAVSRLRRRWIALNPSPTLSLGSLRRRYHANLARYLYD
jgi:hypothetical protein